MHHAFLYISLPVFARTELRYGPSEFNSRGFAYVWQSKWVGIIERTQIHFVSDVFVAVASLDLKVPNIDQSRTPSI